MSGKYTCNLCNKEFSSKSNLTRHTQTVKSCNGPECPEKRTFSCEFCKKELTSKNMLSYHKNICKQKTNKSEVEELKLQVQMMATELNKIKDMKEKSITTNTFNITNNNNYGSILNCLTQEAVQESFKNFSMKDLLSSDGQKTLADMTIKNCLLGPEQPIYICKDRSRHKFFYTDQENKEKEDPNAITLRTLVYNGVKPLIKKLYTEKYILLQNELARSRRKDDLSLITMSHEDIKELENAYKQINIIKDGDDYISQLSKCLPSSIKDRLYQDQLELENADLDSDIELQEEIKKHTRMIGDYTASELSKWKKLYKETGEATGPRELETDFIFRKQFIAFLKEKD